MNSTRIFVCHDLDLTVGTQVEVQILRQLRQKLEEGQAEVVLYPGRASDEGFLAFLYQQLSTCQWFILFQTESAIHSFGVQSAVSIAKVQVAQKQIQAILRFIALPGEAAELPPAWSALPTFGATIDYRRALEKLLLTLSLDQEAQTDPVPSPPVALFEATGGAFSDPPLTAPPPPVADLATAPLSLLEAQRQKQMILPDPLSPASALSSGEQTQVNLPAVGRHAASLSAIDRPAKRPPRFSKGQRWLSASLASVLILGALLLTVVLSLRIFSTPHPGTPLTSSSAATPSTRPTADRAATANAQASATASTQSTASAQASAIAATQSTASAQASATASARSTAQAARRCPPTISQGSTGTEVRLLQEDLNARLTPSLAVDGIFGPQTEAAVKRWQQTRGLDVDGIVGPKTWNSLGECR